jgi:hypothetical protein
MVEIHPTHAPRWHQLGLSDFGSFMRHFGSATARGKTGVMVQRHGGGEGAWDVYFKVYEFKKPAWEFIGRRSKARREYENYKVFERLRIPAALHLACGEERDGWGRLKRAFILTQTIAGAETLVDFFEHRLRERRLPEIRRVRSELMRQLADLAWRLHEAGFFHHDLVWRNILVTWDGKSDPPKLWFIDCPRGRFCHGPLLKARKQIKDLGSLDKTQARHCTRTERLIFFLRYLKKNRLDLPAKRLIRRVLNYRRRRWPDDWNEG